MIFPKETKRLWKSVVHVDFILRDRKHFLSRELGKGKKTKLLGNFFAMKPTNLCELPKPKAILMKKKNRIKFWLNFSSFNNTFSLQNFYLLTWSYWNQKLYFLGKHNFAHDCSERGYGSPNSWSPDESILQKSQWKQESLPNWCEKFQTWNANSHCFHEQEMCSTYYSTIGERLSIWS